jgi:lysyl-tRNA synthetase class I
MNKYENGLYYYALKISMNTRHQIRSSITSLADEVQRNDWKTNVATRCNKEKDNMNFIDLQKFYTTGDIA